MALLVAAAAGGIRWSEQQLRLKHADPCVRLLHRDGVVGCATPRDGVVAPLHPVLESGDLLKLPTQGPLALALSGRLFDLQLLHSAHMSLGDRLVAVLVLHSTLPPGSSPGPVSTALSASERAFTSSNHSWFSHGLALFQRSFPFGMALLDADETTTVLNSLGLNHNGTAQLGSGPVLQMHYPMFAHKNSPNCLSAGSCLPLGGQSVWGSLGAYTPKQPQPIVGKPAVLLTAALDGAAFFHEHTSAADAAVSGIAALIGAVDAVVSNEQLLSALPLLPRQMLFALFTGEAWGGLGSRRFFHDVQTFNCSIENNVPQSIASASNSNTSNGTESLPSMKSCDSPFKPDLRFLAIRGAIQELIEIGPIGSKDARGQLFIHEPLHDERFNSLPLVHTVAEAFRNAAHGMPMLAPKAADATLGLPPGPALSMLGEQQELGAPEFLSVASLTDFNSHYVSGARTASHFETVETINTTLVCQAATLSARAWWQVAGGQSTSSAELFANCTLIDLILGCLSSKCSLAHELGVHGPLISHYTGVFLSEPDATIISPTSRFVTALLKQRVLRPTCVAAAHEPCEPMVALHDAYSTAIERDEETGRWRVLDLNSTLWAESDWPSDMYTILWPHGSPSLAEGFGMIMVGVINALLTIAIVCYFRPHDTVYRRL